MIADYTLAQCPTPPMPSGKTRTMPSGIPSGAQHARVKQANVMSNYFFEKMILSASF